MPQRIDLFTRFKIFDAIRELYPEHGPTPIMERFGLPKGTISRIAWEIGVSATVSSSQNRRICTNASKNTSVDQTYFERWSPNMAYILGYIWADGTVRSENPYKLQLRCKESDGQLIHDICRELKAVHKISRYCIRPSVMAGGRVTSPSNQVGVQINNKILVNSLIHLRGIPPNKSNIDPLFPYVPEDFLPHFARGLFDGDGFICQGPRANFRVGFYGTRRFITTFQERVVSAAGVRKNIINIHLSSKKICGCIWHSNHDILALKQWMYPPGDFIFLARKSAVFDRVVPITNARQAATSR